MPELTIPLIGPYTTRTIDPWSASSKDQVFKNCFFNAANNSITKNSSVYIEKRPGWETNSTPAAGSAGRAVYHTPFDNARRIITVFGSTSVTFYSGTTVAGTATFTGNSTDVLITETVISGTKYIIFGCTGGIYFLPEGATSVVNFTGDTHTNTVIDNVSSLTGLYVGQIITGTGIQANTRIATISAPSTITTTLATTATNSGVTITHEAVAKIIDADLPGSVCGQVVAMDGYLFTGTTGGLIYNSDLNSIQNWNALSFIPTSFTSTIGASVEPFGVWRIKNYIVAMGYQNIEWFTNAGNPTGSVLSRVQGSAINIGANSMKGVAQVVDDVYFISSESAGTNGVYVIAETSVQKVSSQIIDNILGSATNTNTSSLSAVKFAGNDSLLLTISQNSAYRSFIYFKQMNLWFEWDGSIPWTITPSTSAFFNNPDSGLGNAALFAVSDLLTTGKVYSMTMSAPVYQDDGSAYSMIVQSQPYVLNKGKGFVIHSVELLADNQSSGSTTLSISRDDYASFQVLGSFDLTQRRKRIMRGGLCRNHAIFKLEDSGNNAWRGQALVVNYSPCAT